MNIEERAHAGNATQNIHPSLMQDRHTHTTAHAASLDLIVNNNKTQKTRHNHKLKGTLENPQWNGQLQNIIKHTPKHCLCLFYF